MSSMISHTDAETRATTPENAEASAPLRDGPARITSFYPVLMTADVAATAAFYQRHLAMKPLFVSDWYVHLQHGDDATINLAVMDGSHDSIPECGRGRSMGLLLNMEVADVDAVYGSFSDAGAQIVQPLRDEAFGQRHFIVAAPDGVLLDVITPIAPSAEFAAGYVADQHHG